MKRQVFNSLIIAISSILFLTGCGSSNDEDIIGGGSDINIPNEEDSECCNAEEKFLAYAFLNNGFVKEIPELRDTIAGKYELKVYSAGGKLHVGYNDLYFALIKISSQGYVRDFDITGITPVMTMTKMGMQHSTPTATEAIIYDKSYPAVRRAWVSFLMSSSDGGFWELSYNASSQNLSTSHAATIIQVDALSSGLTWLKSFKSGNSTYYLSLVNPNNCQTGINTIQAYVSKQSTDKTKPYLTADETFTIEITPTMPDMGDHSSPNNEPLTLQESGIYEGKLNLSMTGLWNIHLVVKDKDGNIVAGADNDTSGYSSLYWTIAI